MNVTIDGEYNSLRIRSHVDNSKNEQDRTNQPKIYALFITNVLLVALSFSSLLSISDPFKVTSHQLSTLTIQTMSISSSYLQLIRLTTESFSWVLFWLGHSDKTLSVSKEF